MTTQIAPRIELIVLDSATSTEGATEAQARRLRRYLDRSGRRDWAMTIAHDVDGLDGKALRQRFAAAMRRSSRSSVSTRPPTTSSCWRHSHATAERAGFRLSTVARP